MEYHVLEEWIDYEGDISTLIDQQSVDVLDLPSDLSGLWNRACDSKREFAYICEQILAVIEAGKIKERNDHPKLYGRN